MIGFTLQQNGVEIASEIVTVGEALRAFSTMFRKVNRPELTIIELNDRVVRLRYDSFTAVPRSLGGRFVTPRRTDGQRLVLLHNYTCKAVESDVAFEAFVTVVGACAASCPEMFTFRS